MDYHKMTGLPLMAVGALTFASSVSAGVPPEFHNIKMAHATISPLVFALFMPLAAIAIRVFKFRGVLWFHAGWMMFNYVLSFAALGTGIYLAYNIHTLDSAHAIIGLVVICGCALQLITGLMHHLRYKSVSRPNKATYLHIWWGRAVITLGAISGGTGLQLARYPKQTIIGYGVGTGIIWILWMGISVVAFIRGRNKVEREIREKEFSVELTDEPVKQVEPFSTLVG